MKPVKRFIETAAIDKITLFCKMEISMPCSVLCPSSQKSRKNTPTAAIRLKVKRTDAGKFFFIDTTYTFSVIASPSRPVGLKMRMTINSKNVNASLKVE